MASAVLLLAFLLVSCPTYHQKSNAIRKNDAVHITYTGNMGVLISSEKTAVWIDGLHEYYGPEYLNPPDSVLEKVYTGTARFKHPHWLLFTHYHRDHFSKKLVNRFLRPGSGHKVIGAPQVVDSFAAKEIIGAWNKNGEVIYDDSANLRIRAFDIPHTWPQRHSKVQNIAYLVEISGVRIVHVGDADTDVDAFDRIGTDAIDVAIVPQWFDSEKGNQIIEKLKPVKTIITHIAPGEKIDNNKTLNKRVAIFFERIGQSVSME